MNSKLIPYVLDFVSFLMQKIRQESEIKEIILYGSVAREEAGAESDIDLFIETEKDLSSETGKILKQYFTSAKYQNYWKPLGVKNEIKIMVGKLSEWKDLQPSILSNGIVLYGKYKAEFGGKIKTLFTWENIHPNTTRVLFNKQLFGYKQRGKFYSGHLQKYNGERMGKGSIIVPIEQEKLFHQLFKRYKVSVKIRKLKEI